jgi:DNA modification methylase
MQCGTTVKVAREINRQGIGYERELQYKAVIMKKLGCLRLATFGLSSRQRQAPSMPRGGLRVSLSRTPRRRP